MNLTKTAGFLTLLLASVTLFYACKKSNDGTTYYVTNAPMSGFKVVPASGSLAGGSIDANYSTKTKLLTYRITWVNLLDTATSVLVRGLADSGAVALTPGTIQTFTKSTTPSVPNTKRDSVFSGTLFIDGVVYKEQDLLAGKYYAEVRTKAKPSGEIRGQFIFNK